MTGAAGKGGVLVIIFNQDFSRNIAKLERLYGGRFSRRFYLVPDHHARTDQLYRWRRLPVVTAMAADYLIAGARRFLKRRNPQRIDSAGENALRGRMLKVVGHQFYFYNFIVQRVETLLSVDASWYWFLGDDAVLHPRFSEETMLQELGTTQETDCVLCRPVLGSDGWIRRIAGSIEEAEACLTKILGASFPTAYPMVVPEAGAVLNQKVAVACTDFFGLSRDCLKSILVPWKRCARERVYVEAAVPNTLLGAAKSPLFIHNFIWDGTVKATDWGEMISRLLTSPTAVFAHPIKLAIVPEEAMNQLRTGL